MHLLNYTQFFLRYRKGALEVATYFFHSPTCFRKYNKVSQIWDQLSNFATSISGSQINLTLHICLIFTEIKGLSIPHMRLVHTICVAIHWLVAYIWKSPSVPINQLKTRIRSINQMEKNLSLNIHSIQFYNKRWDSWFSHGGVLFRNANYYYL